MDSKLQKRIKTYQKKKHENEQNSLVKTYTAFFLTFDIIDNYVNTKLNESDVSRAGRNILHLLIMNDGGMTATEISKQVWRSTYSVVRVVDTLQRDGYVVRVPPENGGDRRKKIIAITEKGIEIAEDLMKISEEILCYQVLDELTEEETGVFFQILEKTRKHVFDLVNKDENNSYLYRKL